VNPTLKRHYIRLIYSKCFRYLAGALVVCALVGGGYGSHPHFTFALCAAGTLFIGRGWLVYLRVTGFTLLRARPGRKRRRIPYIHQRFKGGTPHRPAFRKDFRDFDDDLTSATAVEEALFDEKEREIARIWANAACGALLILLSFVL